MYDTLGSKLFEVIAELPEYGLTRADERLLRGYAHEIVRRIPGDVILCELGSGSGRKTRWILEALSRRRHTNYFPIEISPAALAVCRRELADIDSVGIVGLEREYLDGLLEVAARRREGQRILVLFLGSTIGNFSSPADVEFLRDIRTILQSGDALLLGTDLEKPVPQLTGAYDDSLGVTAAFNLNLLARINRELDAGFDLSQFEHVAKFNSETQASRCTFGPCGGKMSTFGVRASRSPLRRENPSGPKTAASIRSGRWPAWLRRRASNVKRSGSTRNGPLRKAC